MLHRFSHGVGTLHLHQVRLAGLELAQLQLALLLVLLYDRRHQNVAVLLHHSDLLLENSSLRTLLNRRTSGLPIAHHSDVRGVVCTMVLLLGVIELIPSNVREVCTVSNFPNRSPRLRPPVHELRS